MYYIATDKRGYQDSVISSQKRKLWVLIRIASCFSNEYPQQMFLSGNKKTINTFWLKKIALAGAMVLSCPATSSARNTLQPLYNTIVVIFQYNLYIFGIHLWTVLYPKPCNNKPCYKEVVVYVPSVKSWVTTQNLIGYWEKITNIIFSTHMQQLQSDK